MPAGSVAVIDKLLVALAVRLTVMVCGSPVALDVAVVAPPVTLIWELLSAMTVSVTVPVLVGEEGVKETRVVVAGAVESCTTMRVTRED